MKIFAKFFGKTKPAKEITNPTAILKEEPKKEPYLTAHSTFGMHAYRTKDEDSSVYFVDEQRGIKKMLIDAYGNILDFPGIVKEAFWVKEVHENYLYPQVRFRSSFSQRDEGWRFEWQVQPDGMYWADEDGYGAEHDVETVLYTIVDLNGNFTQPFQIYRRGVRGYSMERFAGDADEVFQKAMHAICDSEWTGIFPDAVFPTLSGCEDGFYRFRTLREARDYWEHPLLSEQLRKLAQAMTETEKSPKEIMGRDSNRLQQSMTLFWRLSGEDVFKQVLDRHCEGQPSRYIMKELDEAP